MRVGKALDDAARCARNSALPLFSVIIPAFNRAHLIGETLESVFAQTDADYEVIVVDDGSTDDTRAVVAAFGGRLRYFWQANAGQGVARNLGVSHAAGQYVVFVDSDDLWFPWTLATYRRVIEAHGRPAVVMAKSIYWTRRDEVEAVTQADGRELAFGDYLASSDAKFLRTACALAVRAEEFRRVGGFTHRRVHGEDHDLLYRLGIAPGFVAVVEPTMVGYRQHAGATTTDWGPAYEGMLYQLDQERRGAYPGGSGRRDDRLAFLMHNARSVSRSLLERGHIGWALKLYWKIMGYQCLHRPRYGFGFPVLMAATALRRATSRGSRLIG